MSQCLFSDPAIYKCRYVQYVGVVISDEQVQSCLWDVRPLLCRSLAPLPKTSPLGSGAAPTAYAKHWDPLSAPPRPLNCQRPAQGTRNSSHPLSPRFKPAQKEQHQPVLSGCSLIPGFSWKKQLSAQSTALAPNPTGWAVERLSVCLHIAFHPQ